MTWKVLKTFSASSTGTYLLKTKEAVLQITDLYQDSCGQEIDTLFNTQLYNKKYN